jgi:hypothetical protein
MVAELFCMRDVCREGLDAGLGDRALYGTAYAFLSLDTEREVVWFARI